SVWRISSNRPRNPAVKNVFSKNFPARRYSSGPRSCIASPSFASKSASLTLPLLILACGSAPCHQGVCSIFSSYVVRFWPIALLVESQTHLRSIVGDRFLLTLVSGSRAGRPGVQKAQSHAALRMAVLLNLGQRLGYPAQ